MDICWTYHRLKWSSAKKPYLMLDLWRRLKALIGNHNITDKWTVGSGDSMKVQLQSGKRSFCFQMLGHPHQTLQRSHTRQFLPCCVAFSAQWVLWSLYSLLWVVALNLTVHYFVHTFRCWLEEAWQGQADCRPTLLVFSCIENECDQWWSRGRQCHFFADHW